LALARARVEWPATVPTVWHVALAYRAMVQALTRVHTEAIKQCESRRERAEYMARIRDAAKGWFPTACRMQGKLMMPCSYCGKWAYRFVPRDRAWACPSCGGFGRLPVLSWALADYLCAIKLGVTGTVLRSKWRRALRLTQRPSFAIGHLVALATAATVLRETPPRGCYEVPPCGKATGHGALRLRLLATYADAVWDMQVSPEAFWNRQVITAQ